MVPPELAGGGPPTMFGLAGVWLNADDGGEYMVCDAAGAAGADGAAEAAPKRVPQFTQKAVPGAAACPHDEHFKICSLPQNGQNLLFSGIS